MNTITNEILDALIDSIVEALPGTVAGVRRGINDDYLSVHFIGPDGLEVDLIKLSESDSFAVEGTTGDRRVWQNTRLERVAVAMWRDIVGRLEGFLTLA